MHRLTLVLRICVAVLAAVAARIFRRLARGPAVPTWPWSTELTVVAARAVVLASTSPGGDRAARRDLESHFDPPLPRSLRDVLEVRKDTVGGISGEWVTRRAIEETSPTILYLHGGGYISCSPATHRRFVARLVWVSRTRAFIPAYRLAPEHPFPAALDDALACYEGLLAMGFDPHRLFVAGDSAGGGLACALLLRLRDGGVPLPRGAILFSPYTDLEHTGASVQENAATDYLPLGEPGAVNRFYVAENDPRHPLISPMYGDYRGAPPLLVFAGGLEMIRDDAQRLVDKARADGAPVSLHIEEDMFHVWPALLPGHPATRRTLARVAAFVAEN